MAWSLSKPSYTCKCDLNFSNSSFPFDPMLDAGGGSMGAGVRACPSRNRPQAGVYIQARLRFPQLETGADPVRGDPFASTAWKST